MSDYNDLNFSITDKKIMEVVRNSIQKYHKDNSKNLDALAARIEEVQSYVITQVIDIQSELKKVKAELEDIKKNSFIRTTNCVY